jgi:hypothetical protein
MPAPPPGFPSLLKPPSCRGIGWWGGFETGVKTGNLNWGEDGSVLFIAANHGILRLRTTTKGKGF